jgi:tRNA (cmo5U34)-methyltransferase
LNAEWERPPPLDAAVSLGHTPDGPWAFDDEVTRVFDDMLARSIPQYGTMRGLVFEVGKRFAGAGSVIVDLGASRGEALAPFVHSLGDTASYVAVEVSPPMLTVCRSRFADEIASGCFTLLDLDLREDYPRVRANLTLSVLTLQFVPLEHRSRIFDLVYEHTEPGGAFVLVEKVLGNSPTTDQLMIDLYHGLKLAHGYSQDEIDRKRLSLEGVLTPVAAAQNEEFLRRAGFSDVECFWRSLNFAGWVAVKGGGSTRTWV